ncbi:MAG: hypothetical protein J7K00_02170 [Candidatus Diapherotrites archaeon]|nr:hypothetical protein [Candidatus Diapherotrites archaeon]
MKKHISIVIGIIILISAALASDCGNLQAYSINSIAEQGESLYYTLEITNNYSFPGTVSLNAQASDGLETVFEINNFSLSALSSKTVTVRVDIDEDMRPGEKTLTFTSLFNGYCSQSDTRTAQIREKTESDTDYYTDSDETESTGTTGIISTIKDTSCRTTLPGFSRTYQLTYVNNGAGGDFEIITSHDQPISVRIDADSDDLYSFNTGEKKTITLILTPEKKIEAGTYMVSVALRNEKSNVVVARDTLCMTVKPSNEYFVQFTPQTFSVEQGSSNKTSLYIKNNENSSTYFVILPKDEFVQVDDSQFTLNAGEDKFVDVTVKAGETEATGEKQVTLTVKGGTVTKTISATVTIKESAESPADNDVEETDNGAEELPELDLNYTVKKNTIDGEVNQILVLFEVTNKSSNPAKDISVEISGVPENWETLVSKDKISIEPGETKEFSVVILPKETKEKFYLETKISGGIEETTLATEKILLSNKKEIPGTIPITGNLIGMEVPPVIGFMAILAISIIGIRVYMHMQQKSQKEEIDQMRNILKKTQI